MHDGQAGAGLARMRSRASNSVDQPGAAIIVNADDWGRDSTTTDRSLECIHCGAVSSVSAMTFMEDSERSAGLARLHGVDAGLHLNFTLPYTAPHCPQRLKEHQEKLSRYLRSHRFARTLYHPGLADSFDYVVKIQLEEYERLFGARPNRVDGHHHMHLCANVTRQKLLPAGIILRRNFSFAPGEKGSLNRLYRRRQDRKLARRYRLTDFFFDLRPIEPRERLARILELAPRYDIEVEAHPIRDEEFRFLVDGELMRRLGSVAVSPGYTLRFSRSGSSVDKIPMTQQARR